jgi:hypothetical protein
VKSAQSAAWVPHLLRFRCKQWENSRHTGRIYEQDL